MRRLVKRRRDYLAHHARLRRAANGAGLLDGKTDLRRASRRWPAEQVQQPAPGFDRGVVAGRHHVCAWRAHPGRRA
jgi:hypothetical protein